MIANVVYVTGNPEKAANFSRHIGIAVEHMAAELDEIQTLNTAELVEHKVRQAYEQLKRPVLVEDVTLECEALAGLPGPFVKFFVHGGVDGTIEQGVERMARMLDGFDNRQAAARCTFGFFDGQNVRLFKGSIEGTIAPEPQGTGGFGFDRIFIPNGFGGKTGAELDEVDYDRYYTTIKPFQAVKEFITT
jgi:non-canonical purine NTP pyrophosphatase (RdgB/HAM1 family)